MNGSKAWVCHIYFTPNPHVSEAELMEYVRKLSEKMDVRLHSAEDGLPESKG